MKAKIKKSNNSNGIIKIIRLKMEKNNNIIKIIRKIYIRKYYNVNRNNFIFRNFSK